jgi:hypothetical protein
MARNIKNVVTYEILSFARKVINLVEICKYVDRVRECGRDIFDNVYFSVYCITKFTSTCLKSDLDGSILKRRIS